MDTMKEMINDIVLSVMDTQRDHYIYVLENILYNSNADYPEPEDSKLLFRAFFTTDYEGYCVMFHSPVTYMTYTSGEVIKILENENWGNLSYAR